MAFCFPTSTLRTAPPERLVMNRLAVVSSRAMLVGVGKPSASTKPAGEFVDHQSSRGRGLRFQPKAVFQREELPAAVGLPPE